MRMTRKQIIDQLNSFEEEMTCMCHAPKVTLIEGVDGDMSDCLTCGRKLDIAYELVYAPRVIAFGSACEPY
jgi:hypothetical protein